MMQGKKLDSLFPEERTVSLPLVWSSSQNLLYQSHITSRPTFTNLFSFADFINILLLRKKFVLKLHTHIQDDEINCGSLILKHYSFSFVTVDQADLEFVRWA